MYISRPIQDKSLFALIFQRVGKSNKFLTEVKEQAIGLKQHRSDKKPGSFDRRKRAPNCFRCVPSVFKPKNPSKVWSVMDAKCQKNAPFCLSTLTPLKYVRNSHKTVPRPSKNWNLGPIFWSLSLQYTPKAIQEK